MSPPWVRHRSPKEWIGRDDQRHGSEEVLR